MQKTLQKQSLTLEAAKSLIAHAITKANELGVDGQSQWLIIENILSAYIESMALCQLNMNSKHSKYNWF